MSALISSMLFRLALLSYSVSEGDGRMRPMPILTTLAELPIVTGEQYGMLFQWLPAVLQDGDGILSEPMTLVRD